MAKKVLVVDDDLNTVKFLSVALEENGFEPIPAYDGKEGLEKLVSDSPDLVLLDVMMPRKTGFSLFKQMRRDERFKDIPVIMLTGVSASLHDLDQKKGETLEHPYDSLREALRTAIVEMREEGLVRPELFIEKPIDPEYIVEKVKGLVGE